MARQRFLFALIPNPILHLPDLHPDLERKLLSHQGTPTRQLLRALQNGAHEWGYSGAVNLSDVGTGKSYTDAAAALSTGRRPIVLCPVVGQEGWKKCFAHFEAEPRFIGSYEAVRGSWRPEVAKLEGKYFVWKNAADSVLILDEAQKVKGNDTMTTAAVGGAIMQGIPIIAASATLATSPLDLRIAGRITGLHNGGADWRRFMTAHGCYLDEQEEPPKWKWNPRFSHVMQTIHEVLIPQRGCRMRKADMQDKMPTYIIPLPFEGLPEAAEIADKVKKLEAAVAGMRRDRCTEAAIRGYQRGARMRIWKACEMALVKPVSERVRACLDEGKSVVCFFNFTPARLAMGKIFKTKYGFFGQQSQAQRKEIEKQFQADRIHLLLCQIVAASASVSLHDVRGERQRETFIFPTNRPDIMAQAPGRVDRNGNKTESYQWIPYLKNPFMTQLLKMSTSKLDRLDTFNNGNGQGRLLR